MQAIHAQMAPSGAWHSEADAALRQDVTQQIFAIFDKRTRGGQSSQRLPDFVKRLEDVLYRCARTKEEYMDPTTLETRLQDVARRHNKGQNRPPSSGLPSSSTGSQQRPNYSGVMAPGMSPQLPSGGGMVPTPGGPGPTGMGFVPTPTNGIGGPPDASNLIHRNSASFRTNGSPAMGPDGVAGNQMPGMVPTSAVGGAPIGGVSANTMMHNGAPVMIKGGSSRDGYGQQVYLNGGSNMVPNMDGPGSMGMQPPVRGSPALQPPGGPGAVSSRGMIPVPGVSGMVPVSNGMVPNPQAPSHSMQPSGPVGPGMVPVGGGGGSSGGGNAAPVGYGVSTSGPQSMMSVPPLQPGSGADAGGGGAFEDTKDVHVMKQQRWLLFLRHCAKCRMSEKECSLKQQCRFGKQLWSHILHCANPECEFPRCTSSKELLKHHQKCTSLECKICVPVKEYVKKTRQAQPQQQNNSNILAMQQQQQQHLAQQQHLVQQQQHLAQQQAQQQQAQQQAQQQQHHFAQRPSQQQQQQQPGVPPGMVPNPSMQPASYGSHGGHGSVGHGGGGGVPHPSMRGMVPQHMAQPPAGPSAGQKRQREGPGYGGFTAQPAAPTASTIREDGTVPGMQTDAQMGNSHHNKRARGPEQPLFSKNTGTSLLETFTSEQITAHTELIRSGTEADRAKLSPGKDPIDDLCGVCGLSQLKFEPPVIYCMTCGLKIKRGQVYYHTPEANVSEIKGTWCHTCYTETKADKQLLEGSNVRKGDLVKKKNDNEEDEPWVACDNCQRWIHQICGLFNKGRNNHDVHYLCPDCLQLGLQKGARKPMEVRPQAMLDATELPATRLSHYLENHMAGSIERERRMRAAQQGKQPSEVIGAEGLSVRVVNNVMKKCETKPKYADTFGPSDNYPTGFPFRQRVIILFQNLDGVDVCLFVMYVQEYGPECPAPNTNVVYLSYLDSVKYFRPEHEMAVGCPNPNTSLRTFVYHQLQVAYLSFVKRLGFEQMFIWACPPMAGDDYILYCHPSKQKTPRSDRLRSWYHDMLKDARARGYVAHMSTLWDMYFDGGKDHRMDRISSTFIPYLDGDYWPGEAENLLGLIIDGGPKGGKKDSPALPLSGSRKGGSKGKRYGGGHGASVDDQLMSRLGDILGGNMKEDFIVVHLKEVCTFCRRHVLEGNLYRYQSSAPLKSAGGRTFEGVKIEGGPSMPTGTFNQVTVCEACFLDEQRRFAERGSIVRLPQGVTPDKLEAVKVERISDQERLVDEDPDIECEHFETRQSFLNLCQGNHFQFDTLRRAKHSSMMVLYHLHNADAPAFGVSCQVCTREIENGTGFRCTVCSDFDICASCQQNVGHPHPLTKHVRRMDETRMRLTEQERKERNEQLQRTMMLVVHACSCNNPQCQSTSCRKVRELFAHAMSCKLKVGGGCPHCKKVFCLLNLHAKSCTTPNCHVPRCREFKELRRRQASRQEDQRRKAYAKMLRAQKVQPA